jgi:hypothetical protein
MEDDHASKMDTMGDAYEQLITSVRMLTFNLITKIWKTLQYEKSTA